MFNDIARLFKIINEKNASNFPKILYHSFISKAYPYPFLPHMRIYFFQ